MAPPLTFVSTFLFLCYCIYGNSAIITNGNKAEGNIEGNNHPPAHLISITEQPPKQNPTRRAESKVDAPRESHLNGEQSIERQSLYSSPSHHYPGMWAIISLCLRARISTACARASCAQAWSRDYVAHASIFILVPEGLWVEWATVLKLSLEKRMTSYASAQGRVVDLYEHRK
jgi:hypothetical protein